MKKLLFPLIILFLTVATLACQNNPVYDIVVTHYAQYDFVKTIVGDDLSVSMAIAPGVEAHGYEPTSQNIVAINRARLFVYTSEVFDPWAVNAVESGNTNTVVLDMSTKIDVDEIEHDHDVSSLFDNPTLTLLEEHDHEGTDPHYWTDLIVAMQMVDALIDQLVELWPEHEADFVLRGETLHEHLHELHEEIETYLTSIPEAKRVIYHAGHVNLAYFAARYHMTVVSLTEQYAPDGDPTSVQIAQMIERLRADQAKYLFYEELSEAQIAKTIQSELSNDSVTVDLLLFHGVHNVSLEDYEAGVTYLQLMEANFLNLQLALSEADV